VLIIGGLAVWWSVGRALRPVGDMTRRASEWSVDDSHRRFALGAPYDEISGLAATLDELLDRIDAALRRERQLTAEIAHELRTPLSSARGEAELALRSADGDAAIALDAIIGQTDRMNSAIETLLAAHAGRAGERQWCDPATTVREVADTVRASASSKGVELDVMGDEAAEHVEVDRQVLAQTLAPVIENAIRHAHSKVSIAVFRREASVVVQIADDGPGVAEQERETIFDPGVSGSGGAGLGLPLARRLADGFGATLIATPSSGGCFELSIPAGRRGTAA
jgi:signal transduction histidine kinase